MRQVFTSPRLENVEAVAELLRAEGIQVKVSNDRSYRGNRRRTFSYRERGDADNQAAVWIVRAEDQPRGRQLLRDAGLLDSSRDNNTSYLSAASLHGGQKASGGSRSMRIKLGLLLLIGIVIALMVFAARKYLPSEDASPAIANSPPAARQSTVAPEMVETLQTYRADVPTALAALLVDKALAGQEATRACVSVDGADPSAALLGALKTANATVSAASACTGEATIVAVSEYMTDGSGSGTVKLVVGDAEAEQLAVSREGTLWRIDP